MYFVLYDRNLSSIGETYILESWSRTQRAIDFDDLKIVGEQIPYYADPFLIVVNDHQGKQVFSGLSSTPIIDDKNKKTTISIKDYMTLMNSEIIVDWSTLSQNNLTLDTYLTFVLTLWLNQTDVGFTNISWDVSRLNKLYWDSDVSLGEGKESVLTYTLVHDAMSYYGIYCIPELDVYSKTLTFVFYPVGVSSLSLRLRDFGIQSLEKSFGEYNRVTVYSHDFIKKQQWAITEDNTVVKLPSDKLLVYPAKNRNFIAEEPTENLSENQSLWNALYDAVMGLSKNRYQINIDLNAKQYGSIVDMSKIDFSYLISVYTDRGFYKDIPVGEIETDSKGLHIIRLGYRVQELTQEI